MSSEAFIIKNLYSFILRLYLTVKQCKNAQTSSISIKRKTMQDFDMVVNLFYGFKFSLFQPVSSKLQSDHLGCLHKSGKLLPGSKLRPSLDPCQDLPAPFLW